MLYERGTQLATLASLVDDLDTAGGKVVLIRGEAGIGKTALVTAFLEEHMASSHVLVGACDDLATPQPFGAIWDIGRQEPSVLEPLKTDDRRGVLHALLELLSRPLRATILVIEDTQWADEATLDTIQSIGRRIARSHGLIVLTYRDGEVDADHPLRQVIGEVPPQNIVRIHLEPLTPVAVAAIIGDRPFDVGEVLSLTDGNPLFVTEVVASGTQEIPLSVQDTILARVAKVTPGARAILDLVSIMPGDADPVLVDQFLSPTPAQLSECEHQGLLQTTNGRLGFMHELQRRAVEASLGGARRRGLNQRVLDALIDREEPSRLLHHAQQAGDLEAIITLAPRAAVAATAIDSHREALEHYRLLDAHLDLIPDDELMVILDGWAREAALFDREDASGIATRAIELQRSHGSPAGLAMALTFGAEVKFRLFRTKEALEYADEAVALLAGSPSTADLARALTMQAYVHWLYYERASESLGLADHAVVIAEESRDDLASIEALSVRGMIAYSVGATDAMELLERSRMLAEESGLRFQEVRALTRMTGMCADVRDVARAADLARRARETAARYDLYLAEVEAKALYAEILLWTGEWAEAEDTAAEAVGSQPYTATLAWRVLGNIQSRRGGSGARSTLERMWSLAATSHQLTVIDPAATVLAEHMWLSDDIDPQWTGVLRDVLAEGIAARSPWPSGAFSFWLWKLGMLDEVPDSTPDFYRWIIEGDHRRAAEFWNQRGVPYEEGLALMHGDDDEMIRALRIFEDLGADAAAARVRADLALRDVPVPRGRSRAARQHAAGLTGRQAEVLGYLAMGLTNTQIADELFISHRTVENHVAAILMKLDAPTRSGAVEAARAIGILSSDAAGTLPVASGAAIGWLEGQ
ncbi:MAG TPA: AAA family ATPase [Acidimicrobiia bacterium]|nr:AAA family ATPase [Acidimicrobiia bacterium]